MLNNIDLVTITCTKDKKLQELQSYSINLMIDTPCDHYIVIEDTVLSIDEWYSILSPYYTKHRLHLVPTLLSSEYYANDTRIKNGWHRSAILKLLIADKVQSNRYLILDSKNFFIRKQTLSLWPLNDGNGIVEKYCSHTWKEIDKFCLKNNIVIPIETYMSATPFVVNTNIVKEILKFDIHSLFFKKADWWSSELLLYSIFTQYFGNKLISERVPNVTFWNNERTLDANTLTEIYNWPNLRSMGLHRDVIKLGTDLTDFIDFLSNIGFDKNKIKTILEIYKQDTKNN